MNNKSFIYILGIITVFCLSACEDFEVESPRASFQILRAVNDGTDLDEANNFEVGEDVFVKNTGTGEMFTVFTGDFGHDGSSLTYMDEEVEKVNTGFFMNHPREETLFKYSYNSPGTYTIKVIAISSEEEGEVVIEDSATKEVTIVEP